MHLSETDPHPARRGNSLSSPSARDKRLCDKYQSLYLQSCKSKDCLVLIAKLWNPDQADENHEFMATRKGALTLVHRRSPIPRAAGTALLAAGEISRPEQIAIRERQKEQGGLGPGQGTTLAGIRALKASKPHPHCSAPEKSEHFISYYLSY